LKSKHGLKYDSRFVSLIHNNLIMLFIKIVPIIGFIISTFLVVIVFNYFFNLGNVIWIYGIVGFLLSILIIKSNYVFSLFSKQEKSPDNDEEKSLNYGALKVIIVMLKTLFFNVMNDLFILTLFWTILFGIAYLAEILSLPSSFDFNILISVITLLGILSGFFQFYIENYKKQVTDKINSVIIEYLRKAIRDVSMDYFARICDEEPKYKEVLKRIGNIITDQDSKTVKGAPTIKSIMNLQLSLNADTHALFHFLEAYAEFSKENSLNRENLISMYEYYFKKKFEQYKTDINNEDFAEVSDTIFASILFFDEILASIIQANFELSSDKDKLDRFDAFHNNFAEDCVYYALDKLLHNEKLISDEYK